MVSKEDLKQKLCMAVDASAPEVKAYVDDVANHPELGWSEKYTSARLTEALQAAGLQVKTDIAHTGLRTDISGGNRGPRIAILGELDAVICRAHPKADPVSGASHSCGHNLQTGAVLAAATALARTGALKDLAGSVALMGVPAEEFIEMAHRKELRDRGEIRYMCGKSEFVRLGEFDDIDMAMMVHAGDCAPDPGFTVPDGGNGFRTYMIQYSGRQAHAAAAPDQGINALYAAVCGINAVNALRETFRDDDHTRVHFIITKGGDSANGIPADVQLEGYVRGRTAECIDKIFVKVMRAFRAGGDAIGAACHIQGQPGDMPLNCSLALNDLFADNAETLYGAEHVKRHTYFSASTDMGDLTQIMPAIHPSAGGVDGALHSADFRVLDFNAAVLAPAKAMLMTVVDLLSNDAVKAEEILKSFRPVFTKEQYLQTLDSQFMEN